MRAFLRATPTSSCRCTMRVRKARRVQADLFVIASTPTPS